MSIFVKFFRKKKLCQDLEFTCILNSGTIISGLLRYHGGLHQELDDNRRIRSSSVYVCAGDGNLPQHFTSQAVPGTRGLSTAGDLRNTLLTISMILVSCHFNFNFLFIILIVT